MAYNVALAERIRSQLQDVPFIEKKMFGGIGFLLQGNMACGVVHDDLIVQFDPDKNKAFLKGAHTRPFAMSGRPMKGWLLVDSNGYKTGRQLNVWIKEGMDFALTLPPK